MEDFERIIKNDIIIERVNLSRATFKEAGMLKSNLTEDIQRQYKKIIVDLNKCEFIDSTFLGVLVLALKQSAKIGGDIRLIKPNSVARSLMEKAGTLNVFNVFDTVEEAVESYGFPSIVNYYLSQGAGILA